jgi:hypothetical protein
LETTKDFTQLNFTLFNQFGKVVWQKDNFHATTEGSDLGGLTQPTVDFVADSSKLSTKFPNKILLFELINGEEAKE